MARSAASSGLSDFAASFAADRVDIERRAGRLAELRLWPSRTGVA